jgi:anthranilate phosphoribosyltransferase
MDTLLRKVNSGLPIGFNEALDLFDAMARAELTEAQIASVLISLKLRGETSDELAALVTVMNRYKKPFVHNARNTIDTCGTGGDGKSTVNVSTAVSIILASMGISVLKHGNAAQSGKVGSADVLTALGFDFSYADKTPEQFFEKNNFVFMFAPHYHPALKGIGKVRREIKVPTIFNFVGPLVNPGNPDYQMIGISTRDRLEFVTDAALRAGKENITFYSSRDGYDEISSTGITECVIVHDGKKDSFIIDSSQFFTPFEMPVVESLEHAVDLFMKGITGDDEQVMNIFSINTALALKTMNHAEMKDAFNIVRETIQSGKVAAKLKDLTGGKH